MSIEIKIIDPANTSPSDLRRVCEFLQSFARQQSTEVVHPVTAPSPMLPVAGVPLTPMAPVGTATANMLIAPNDNPAAGADTHGSPELDAAKLNALAGPGAAGPTAEQVFGGGTAPAPTTVFAQGTDPNVSPGAAFTGSASAPAAPTSSTAAHATAQGATAANTSIPLDADGLPHDPRIHSGNKTTNADGRWKKKRGVDEVEVARVEAELRQVMAIPGPGAAAAPVVPNVPAAGSPVAPVPGLPTAVPPPPAAPSVPNVPPTAPVVSQAAPVPGSTAAALPAASAAPSGPMTFPQLMPKITAAIAAKTITQEQVAAACAALGLPGLPMLVSRPDLVPTFAASLGLQ